MSDEAKLHDLHQKVSPLSPWWSAQGHQIAERVQIFWAQSVLQVLFFLSTALPQPVISKTQNKERKNHSSNRASKCTFDEVHQHITHPDNEFSQ
jgi:hypothetical protein